MNQQLISAFQDTQRRLWENKQLYRLTSQAIMYTHIFPENFETTRIMGNYATVITVTGERTLQAAERLTGKYGKAGVLNAINAVNPGGNVGYGQDGQEEDLCRCSNLYPCLMKPDLYKDFYGYNNQRNQYYSDRIIFSPNVTVFKKDEQKPEYTDAWYQIDVLSCPPPNLNGITVPDYQKLEKIYNKRIRNILAVAQAHGVQALVLGDFGCHTYLNPPELVAKAFLNQLNQDDFRGVFREVVFAVRTDSPQGLHNYQVFRSVIESGIPNPLFGKKISVLGDSISTYWGSNPKGYRVFYDGEKCLRAGMYSVEDTWWMKVIRHSGGQLLVNNSYSGSRVSGNSLYSGNSDYRLHQLHNAYGRPDVILIAMGMNDYEYGVPIEPDKNEPVTENSWRGYFRESYQIMLWRLRQIYPQAVIYCATLCYGTYGEQTENPFPRGLYGIPLRTYNQIIRECAAEYGCCIADLEKKQEYYETIDGIHPTVIGMTQLAQGWLRSVTQWNDEENIEESEHSELLYWLLGGIVLFAGIIIFMVLLK